MKRPSRQLEVASAILMASVLILTGCNAAMPAKVTSNPVQEWYLAPPADTADALYGTGERSNLEQAKKAALAEIAGKLGTAIQAETTLRNSLSDGKTEESFQETISASVADTEFSGYEVVETAHTGSSYRVLVKVDKQQMAENVRFRLGQQQEQLDQKFSAFEAYSLLRRVQVSEELSDQLDKAQTLALTLRALDPSYDPSPVAGMVRDRKQWMTESRDSLEVAVIHDKNTGPLATRIESMLNDHDIKVVNGSGKGKTRITLTSRTQLFEVLGDYQAKMQVDVKTVDEKGKVLATSDHTIAGYSRTSHAAAVEQANNKLAEEFAASGLLKTVGF